ncbi:MAG: thiamine pyrophosphate-dependent enzyme [Bacteroidales bacterium]|nr:thiamine pyrophosphate-dependent enzyme [Bacteroidales bacterium]MCI2121855.1 thiamine pyrophosphate-dependent enzyme [Bacteroidales bacterium]MCI2145122.1 thiamine pyrophosphate-dependent enzyme [Bacteroidales bacterium]
MGKVKKKLFLGDQAIAQGAIDAGISGVYAYPGTPSTEITEYIQDSQNARSKGSARSSEAAENSGAEGGKIFCRWCTNEKTAMEAALGSSFAGKRALVCMKHVGLNVCADAFVNSAVTGVNGGLVVLVADDPSMHSSQNEQDSRFYGKFALIPTLEPSTQQEAYDMMRYAFDFSERLGEPVLIRLVTRLAHSRSVVELSDRRGQNPLHYPKNPMDFVLLPAIAKRRYATLCDLQATICEEAEHSGFNRMPDPVDMAQAGENRHWEKGVIACGIAFNYLSEAYPEGFPFPVLKLSQYPVPVHAVRRLAELSDEITVIEDGQPFVEEQLRGILPIKTRIKGRLSGELPRTGELNPDNVRVALGLKPAEIYDKCELVVGRPPALCQGCGHRDVYAALNEVLKEYPNAKVFGDIGCYTLGALPPYRAISSCVDMGASVTMAKGAADAGQFPSVAVIGDSTFTHSGITGLLDAVNSKSNIVIIISDNLTTAMTGGQDSAGTGRLESICKGIGVEQEHVRVVVPLPKNMPEITGIIRDEINYKGVSVIIPRRECIQTAKRKAKNK